MKSFKHFLVLLFISAVTVLQAQNGVLLKPQPVQNPSKPVLSEEKYKAIADGWMIDINKAYAVSRKTGKPILANFTGSDWCGWCIKLKREVFSKEEFKIWAKKNVVLLFLDYPRRSALPQKYVEQNASLQRAFQITGYPTLWLFNLDKNAKGEFTIDALGKTGYVAGGPKAFQKGVENMIKKRTATKG